MSGRTLRVLVVEDDHRIAAMLTKGIHARGHQAIVTATGSGALASVADDVDVMLLDLGLPDQDGLDVLRQLERSGTTLPVVVVTARSDPSDREAAFELGVCAYITKPFSWRAVWSALEGAAAGQ